MFLVFRVVHSHSWFLILIIVFAGLFPQNEWDQKDPDGKLSMLFNVEKLAQRITQYWHRL